MLGSQREESAPASWAIGCGCRRGRPAAGRPCPRGAMAHLSQLTASRSVEELQSAVRRSVAGPGLAGTSAGQRLHQGQRAADRPTRRPAIAGPHPGPRPARQRSRQQPRPASQRGLPRTSFRGRAAAVGSRLGRPGGRLGGGQQSRSTFAELAPDRPPCAGDCGPGRWGGASREASSLLARAAAPPGGAGRRPAASWSACSIGGL